MRRIVLPPLKSQGIKSKLVPWIQSFVPVNVTGRWIEPFLGTGAVAFNSGFKSALLADINPYTIEFYKRIQQGLIHPASVRAYLEKEGSLLVSAGDAHFRYIRNRFNIDHDPLDLLFMSRAGFNGLMRFNKRGEWNVPFCKKPNRFSKSYVTKIVNQVQDTASIIQPNWEFRVSSFEEIIREASINDIIYCDPPYIGRHVDYFNGWNEDNERQLFDLLSSTPALFILSTWHHNDYRENRMIQRFWSRFNIVTRDYFYHAGGRIENRKPVVEALVYNFQAEITPHNHHDHAQKPTLKAAMELFPPRVQC